MRYALTTESRLQSNKLYKQNPSQGKMLIRKRRADKKKLREPNTSSIRVVSV